MLGSHVEIRLGCVADLARIDWSEGRHLSMEHRSFRFRVLQDRLVGGHWIVKPLLLCGRGFPLAVLLLVLLALGLFLDLARVEYWELVAGLIVQG